MLNKVFLVGHIKSIDTTNSTFAKIALDVTPQFTRDQAPPTEVILNVAVTSAYVLKKFRDFPDSYKVGTSLVIEGELASSKNGNICVLVQQIGGNLRKFFHMMSQPKEIKPVSNGHTETLVSEIPF